MITLDRCNISDFLTDDQFGSAMPKARNALSSILNREGKGAGMLGWLDLPHSPKEDIDRIAETALRIRERNDCLVVAGIGGSYLGARAAIDALCGDSDFPVYFAGNNLSSLYHGRLIDRIRDQRFAVCVISKSGTTTETAIAFRLLRDLMKKQDEADISDRIIAVTDPERGALKEFAEDSGIAAFSIPDDVGGRFSVLSPVGLFPCAAAGIPVGRMLDGARRGLSEYSMNSDSNIMLIYALARHMMHENGFAAEVLSTFQPEMATFCEWWKQLAGESEGKEGKGLFPASTVMTTDLHSLGQLLQEGRRDIIETFLVSKKDRREIHVPEDSADLDRLNYLAGKSLTEINRKAYEGTRAAHIAGGLPVLSLEIPSVTPGSIGELFIFFELAISVSGRLAGINPFNQPGVEEYKKRMFRLLGKPGVN